MIVDFIILIFVVRYLKKTLQTADKFPVWDKIFTVIFFVSLACLVVTASVGQKAELLLSWMGNALLLFILYILYAKKEFRSLRSYMLALAPYICISVARDLVELLLPGFYTKWENYIDAIDFSAFIWLIAMLIINKRQQKALQTEKLRTKEEEEQNKVMVKMKAELEIQVKERTAEITLQKEELQLALNELRATQSQLVQSEKMASLGELTAGIAHEIQNPLNFVNNFSEVNTELITEMKEAIDKGNMDEVRSIANDIADNEQKINHHGKRADAIVKGMLQHSRSSNGIKEPTNINTLADEYLRLAYHGLRAKDKSFNASMKTAYDENMVDINIIPQDIGRVILNLITNAFYAVTEKKKEGTAGYEPTVSVSTMLSLPVGEGRGEAIIKVKDNGNGIPKKVIDKIFQPFFTTKPTGQGTGLGLSMSYDIVTKGHGGELDVETKEGEGSEFIVRLPV